MCALQARVKAVAEIVDHLVRGVQQGDDVDLNLIKREATSKYALARAPKLVDIIAAVPEEYKATLLPRYASRLISKASSTEAMLSRMFDMQQTACCKCIPETWCHT